MADVLTARRPGEVYGVSESEYAEAAGDNPLTRFANIAAAVVSLTLVAGIAVWGYKLVMRDVTGLPVIQRAAGEMRVRPDDPGGVMALHQGLAVNAVAAEGSAEKPADRLVLAPRPVALLPEDQPIEDMDVAALQQAPTDAPQSQADAIASVLAEIVQQNEGEAQIIQASVPVPGGIGQSLRPKLRPRWARQPAPLPDSREIDAALIPSGTRVAQLGAFDDPEVARQEWAQLQARFAPYMAGKSRVVQQAQSGGRVFYRLRAMGFTDLADARRFCSALMAEDADCIPVEIK